MNVSWTTSSASAADPVIRYDIPQRSPRFASYQRVSTSSVGGIVHLCMDDGGRAPRGAHGTHNRCVHQLTDAADPVSGDEHVAEAAECSRMPPAEPARSGVDDGVADGRCRHESLQQNLI